MFYQDVSSGASSDLKYATAQLRQMITRFGFGTSLGLYAPNQHEVSEATAKNIDEEIMRILSEQYARAKQIISENAHMIR